MKTLNRRERKKMKKNFRKFMMFIALAALCFMTVACNEIIPAGHKGKIMGKTGFQPEIYPPSKVWLSNNLWNIVHEKLYLVQTTTKKYEQPIEILLKDKLTLKAKVVFRGRINGSDKVINSIFDDMTMDDRMVTVDEVYDVYGKMVVLNTAREIISQYNVDEVNQNYKRITIELYQALEPKLDNLPIEISDVTLGGIKYPQIVTDAIEQAKKRRMDIEKKEADVQIALTEAKGREEVAKAEYRIKMLEAKRIRDYNKMISEGVTADLLALREIELREAELAKWDGHFPLKATTVMGTGAPVIVDTTNEDIDSPKSKNVKR
jgi:regulator of protease activity HflC (stomatin/prohibitin superfamily)